MNKGQDPMVPAQRTHHGERWRFLRDVLVFQLKLFLDNVRDFGLVPVSLAAALVDLIYKGKREGALFYKVLRWGRHSEEVIDVYSAIAPASPEATARQDNMTWWTKEGEFQINPKYRVDAIVARLEEAVVREVEKGGTAASIKAVMDRTIDEIHRGTGETRDAVFRAADKLRLKIDPLPDETDEKN